MKRNIDSGKGFLQDKLGGYQADPPEELWGEISGRLKGRGRSRKLIIILSAAASLALAISLGISWSGRDMPQDAELAGAPSPTSSPKSGLEERVVEAMAEVNSPTDEDEENTMDEGPALAVLEARPDKEEETREEETREEEILEVAAEETLLEETLVEGAVMGELAAEEFSAKAAEELADEEQDIQLDDIDAVGDEIVLDLDQDNHKDLKWVLGAVLSPLYSFRDAQPEALAGSSNQERGTVAYATGVQVGFKPTRRLAIESGILFNKMGISIGAPGIQVYSDANSLDAAGPESVGNRVMAVTNTVGNMVSNSGEIYVNNYLLSAAKENQDIDAAFSESVYADQGIRQHLDYLEIPLNLRYNLLDRNFKIQLLGGMSTNLLVNNYITMESDGLSKEIGYLSNVRSVNYSGNAGLGFVYHFLDQLSLSVEPRFRYYLNSVNDATLPSTRPYTFGIYTGINYFF